MPFSNPHITRGRGGIGGKGDVRKNIAKLIRELPKEVGRATKAEMQIEKRESQKITPWLTGELHDSHQVIEPVFEGGRIYSGVAVGNEKTVTYDVIIHEDLELFHRFGEAKFLEKTMRASAPYMAERIAVRVDLKRVIEE